MNKITKVRFAILSKSTSSVILSPTFKQTIIALSSRIPKLTLVRSSHTDIPPPDFSEYRKKSTKYPKSKSSDSLDARRNFTAAIALVTVAAATYATKSHLLHYIFFMAASKDVLALSKIEVRLSDIQEGRMGTYKWRGKPLFVRHRTDEEVAIVRATDITTLRDPQRDEDRVQKENWLVIIGICTHLGCVPINGLGDFGGFYCPCHGSHFDASGRARKGPAPSNMEVPVYTFLDDNTLIVG